MNLSKKHTGHLTNNPEGYWFKRKVYGWGWTPARWQGWAVLFGHIVFVLIVAVTIDPHAPTRQVIVTNGVPIILLTIALLRICYKKGEKPRWQWGAEPKK